MDWEKATKYTGDESLHDFIDNSFDPEIQAIQNQIDRKIESWFQTTDPATAWTTADDKYAHLGDMWYNSSTKLLKRYTVNNSVYAWETIEDQKAIDAYATASNAQDTADKKKACLCCTTSHRRRVRYWRPLGKCNIRDDLQ